MTRAEWIIDGYKIVSHGNGLSYAVERLSDGRNFFLQGDDASDWRDGYDRADASTSPLRGVASFLAESMLNYGQPANG